MTGAPSAASTAPTLPPRDPADAELQVAGTIAADAVEYNSPHLHYLSVSPAAFQARNSTVETQSLLGQGYVYVTTSGTNECLAAPVYFPDGAEILELQVILRDNDDADLTVDLGGLRLETGNTSMVASVASSGTSTDRQTLTALPIPSVASPVDNSLFAYRVRACSPDWPGSNDLGLGAVRVAYQTFESP